MIKPLISFAALCALAACQTVPSPAPLVDGGTRAEGAAAPSPAEIVAEAKTEEWKPIPASDLMVMTLAPDAEGKERRVVIQLIPAPFSQGWVDNIRKLTNSGWYDGTAIIRVQDNYVTQWGDPDGDDKDKAKPLPAGLKVMPEADYVIGADTVARGRARPSGFRTSEPYATGAFVAGWPVGSKGREVWPVHCYGMVGVARDMSPNTGDGSSLYTVIGHAPRHLDRNIAVVGRVIEGMEHLSSLPRGTGNLGFYEKPEDRTPIVSVRLASEIPAPGTPRFEYLDTDGDTFARYSDARANRRDPFFIVPAGGADICNIPVPVRRVAQ